MPKNEKIFTLDISPERFFTECSREELIEVELLLNSPRFKVNPTWDNNRAKSLKR